MATPTQQQRIEPDYPKDRTTLGGPRLGVVGWARWAWRQLTSMRTAILLLLLLAAAAVPGSLWPQRAVDPVQVRRYFENNPELAPWLDRLYLFDVFSSPWFAAIYLLLSISLIGCIVPRFAQHVRSLTATPPAPPRRLNRMPATASATLTTAPDRSPASVLTAAEEVLRGRRFRVRPAGPGELALTAEKGYLKETGNLVFHVALLGVIVAFAVGHLFGWRGEVIITEGETWTSSSGTYDSLQFGSLTDEAAIPTFTISLEQLDVAFESEATGGQFGQPRRFDGVALVEVPGQEPRRQEFAVNHPVSVAGDSIFLLGNGYAPRITVRDPAGTVIYSDAVTFLPQDNTYGSDGAVKVVGRDPNLGLVGSFLPTINVDPETGMTSAFPGLVDPALVMTAFEGELFPGGQPQSVFEIDTEDMTQMRQEDGSAAAFILRPGEFYELPDGTVVEFETVHRWAGLLVRHDPGRLPALGLASLAVLGLVLMLGVKRRRVYVRLTPGAEGHTEITVAGLPKGSDPGLQRVVDDLLARVLAATGAAPGADPAPREDTA